MRQNDRYAPFRPPLTAEQRERIERSEKPAEEYRRIAVEEAKKQLALVNDADGKKVILPDDPDICLRLPGVDPRGEYSIIDFRFKARTMRLDAVLNLREEGFRRQIQDILSSGPVRERWAAVKELAQRHRILTRAEKLCWDEEAADSLHIQMRRLETEPVVAELDLVFQGLEYLIGIREGLVPAEVDRFYRESLGVTFTPEQRETARRLIQPGESEVFFADFENVLLQALFSMPENWGLTLEELEALRDTE